MKSTFKDLLGKDGKSLIQDNREILEKLMGLRFAKQRGNLEKPSEIRKLRRERARVQTALTQKRMEHKG